MMTKRICMFNITGECRNPSKGTQHNGDIKLECPHCLRIDGKDGHGNQLIESEKAEKVFEILRDKIEE